MTFERLIMGSFASETNPSLAPCAGTVKPSYIRPPRTHVVDPTETVRSVKKFQRT